MDHWLEPANVDVDEHRENNNVIIIIRDFTSIASLSVLFSASRFAERNCWECWKENWIRNDIKIALITSYSSVHFSFHSMQ